MVLDVEVISTQTIKPSSPTLPHLKTLKLCLLDQLVPSAPIHFVLFYAPTQHKTYFDKLDHLTKSLSDVLTLFYPLAGRISDNLTVDCTDEGVNFFQTRVIGKSLDHLVTSPIFDELTQLLPNDNFAGEAPMVLLSVQANAFECGGIALGVRLSHKIGDASSMSFFLHTWAAVARGEHAGTASPKFDMTSLFPPKDFPSYKLNYPSHRETSVTKKFLFSASNISALRAKCSDELHTKNPSRVEVITALIWRCLMNISSTTSTLVHSVNLRRRMAPPLSSAYFGNLVTIVAATMTVESSQQLPCLVGRVRESITKIDSEYAQDGDKIFEFQASFMKNYYELYLKGETEVYTFTSWCRLPFYEVDFGWGKPVWVSPAKLSVKNTFVLLDTKSEDGIEACISLCEADMARFECEPQLIEFTT